MDFKSFYDKTARTYDKRHDSPASIRLRKMEDRLVKQYARGRVLDIGCGTGFHMNHAGLDIDVIGIDISDEMLRIARKNGLKVDKGSAEQILFPDNSFHTIFCFFAVLNMCDSEKAVKEMARALKPSGCALLSLSSIHDKRYFKISKQKVELKKLFTKSDLVGLFEKNGFVLESFDSAFRTGRPRWGDYSRAPLRERASLWLDRFRDVEKGVVYLAVFKKQ
jgi:ubiquinone/menaquinone biosynthesis C-methylase UbiE